MTRVRGMQGKFQKTTEKNVNGFKEDLEFHKHSEKKKKKRQTKVGSLEILWKKNVQLVLKFPDLFVYFPSYFW